MSREQIVYEKVYRVEFASSGISMNPDYHDADTPEDAGRFVTDYLRGSPTWKWVTVRPTEVCIT